MSKLSTYYLYIAVICLALSIYNFSISNQSQYLQCFTLNDMSESDYQIYMDSLSNTTSDYSNYMIILDKNITEKIFTDRNRTNTTADGLYTVPVLQENKYSNLQVAIGAIYLTIMILSIFLSVTIKYMSDLVPEEFLKMNKLTQSFGFLSKNLPYLIIMLHYTIPVLLIVIWGYVGTTSCYYSVNIIPGQYIYWNKFYMDTWTMNLVISVFWIFLHYFASIIKEVFYREPFMYVYSQNEKGKFRCLRWMMTKVGP